MKIALLVLAAAVISFWAGTRMPGKITIKLSEYQSYVCGYVDGQRSILSELPPGQSLPADFVDRAKCPSSHS